MNGFGSGRPAGTLMRIVVGTRSAISIAATASKGGRPMWIVCRPANAGGTWFQNFGNDCQSGAVGGTNSIGTANGSAIGRIHAQCACSSSCGFFSTIVLGASPTDG